MHSEALLGGQQPSKSRRLCLLVLFVVVCAWAVTATTLYAIRLKRSRRDQCTSPCICSVAGYITAFDNSLPVESTRSLGRAACISDNLFGVVAKLGTGQTLSENLKYGDGKRFAFIAGPRMLEKFLVLGRYDAKEILIEVGYGDNPSVANSTFHLTVFEKPRVIFEGYWEHLHPMMKEIYGSKLPDIADAAKELQKSNFEQVSGCKEGTDTCDACFSDPFSDKSCSGEDASSPTYTGSNDCTAEDEFLGIAKPTACQLRSYLYKTQSFYAQYTGYGYTANTYREPLGREFWTPNVRVDELKNVQTTEFFNGKPGSSRLEQSPNTWKDTVRKLGFGSLGFEGNKNIFGFGSESPGFEEHV